jgi:hypothetical protein
MSLGMAALAARARAVQVVAAAVLLRTGTAETAALAVAAGAA